MIRKSIKRGMSLVLAIQGLCLTGCLSIQHLSVDDAQAVDGPERISVLAVLEKKTAEPTVLTTCHPSTLHPTCLDVRVERVEQSLERRVISSSHTVSCTCWPRDQSGISTGKHLAMLLETITIAPLLGDLLVAAVAGHHGGLPTRRHPSVSTTYDEKWFESGCSRTPLTQGEIRLTLDDVTVRGGLREEGCVSLDLIPLLKKVEEAIASDTSPLLEVEIDAKGGQLLSKFPMEASLIQAVLDARP